jgi:hypothetical protein
VSSPLFFEHDSRGGKKAFLNMKDKFIIFLLTPRNIIPTSDYCPIEAFRKLLEQRFSIKLSEIHISDLLKFTHNDPSKSEINWMQFFKRLSEIE